MSSLQKTQAVGQDTRARAGPPYDELHLAVQSLCSIEGELPQLFR